VLQTGNFSVAGSAPSEALVRGHPAKIPRARMTGLDERCFGEIPAVHGCGDPARRSAQDHITIVEGDGLLQLMVEDGYWSPVQSLREE
jgi:hypothetical protein